jgi:hypothetical protein
LSACIDEVEIRQFADLQDPSVGKAVERSRPLRQHMDGLLDAEQAALAHPFGEQKGRCAAVADGAHMGAAIAQGGYGVGMAEQLVQGAAVMVQIIGHGQIDQRLAFIAQHEVIHPIRGWPAASARA